MFLPSGVAGTHRMVSNNVQCDQIIIVGGFYQAGPEVAPDGIV